MKLLLDEMENVEDVGLIHTIYHTSNGMKYIRRRSYPTPQTAAKHYFTYCDMMSASGYTIKSVIARAWYYEIWIGEYRVESVAIDWPKQDWNDEMKLLEHKKK